MTTPPHALLDCARIDEFPGDYLARIGTVFATFDKQDSGNVAYGVELPSGERYFVKTAGDPLDTSHVLDHPARVELIRNAARLATEIRHPLLPRLHQVIESPAGPMLVYDWADGELVGVPADRRSDDASPYQRFRALPAAAVIAALDGIVDLHEHLAARGWIASDFYDGCLIYDFARNGLRIIDLDTYNKGAFTNTMGRMFGSTRFMAPEEFEPGAAIDERTTVFTLGRTVAVFLSDGTLEREPFRGPEALHAVMTRACAPAPGDRFPSVAAFASAWRAAQPDSAATSAFS